MTLPASWFGAIAAAIFALGSVTGGATVYKLWDVSVIKTERDQYLARLSRLNRALEINQVLEADDDEAEKHNATIDAAISRMVKARFGDPVPSAPGSAAGDPVCVDADRMLAIGSYK